ncbi:unnamed protein product [Schistosoma curassoni]|uniref:Uncharacterized protein n=1 Tax=Schistosoma curassoni TaxID=6186 RepID=A0A183K394_9TREM|nr:unnamed protein product [Schistosoma curassoni]
MIAFSSANEKSRFYSIFIMILNIMLEAHSTVRKSKLRKKRRADTYQKA